MLAIFKSSREQKQEPELKDSCYALFSNLNIYLTEVCGNLNDTTTVSSSSSNSRDVVPYDENACNTRKNTRQNRDFEKKKAEFKEDVLRFAKGCQDAANQAAKHLNEDIQRVNQKLERAIDDERRKNQKKM